METSHRPVPSVPRSRSRERFRPRRPTVTGCTASNSPAADRGSMASSRYLPCRGVRGVRRRSIERPPGLPNTARRSLAISAVLARNSGGLAMEVSRHSGRRHALRPWNSPIREPASGTDRDETSLANGKADPGFHHTVSVRRSASARDCFSTPSWLRSRKTSAAARLAANRPTSIRIPSVSSCPGG